MKNPDLINIGTYNHRIDKQQASLLKDEIEHLGLKAEIIVVEQESSNKGSFDLNVLLNPVSLSQTLHKALQNREIHIAIHPSQESPAEYSPDTRISSFGKRHNAKNVFVKNDINRNVNEGSFEIGTVGNTRITQWRNKYPGSEVHKLNGNISSQLEEMKNSNWDGIVTSFSDLEAFNLTNEEHLILDWMIPMPTQGIPCIMYMKKNAFIYKLVSKLQNEDVELCFNVEKVFSKKVTAGFEIPHGAHAFVHKNTLFFKACILDSEGRQSVFISKSCSKNNALIEVENWAREILDNGGREILESSL